MGHFLSGAALALAVVSILLAAATVSGSAGWPRSYVLEVDATGQRTGRGEVAAPSPAAMTIRTVPVPAPGLRSGLSTPWVGDLDHELQTR